MHAHVHWFRGGTLVLNYLKMASQEICEDFALEIFTKADDEDRAGNADKCAGCLDLFRMRAWFKRRFVRMQEYGENVLRGRYILRHPKSVWGRTRRCA
jgi:hypothetical protein